MNNFRYKFEPDALNTFVIWVWKLKILQRMSALLALLHPKILQLLKANISSNITRKQLKLSVIIYFHTLLSLPSLICIVLC